MLTSSFIHERSVNCKLLYFEINKKKKKLFFGVKDDKRQIAVLYFIKSLILLFILTMFEFICFRKSLDERMLTFPDWRTRPV